MYTSKISSVLSFGLVDPVFVATEMFKRWKTLDEHIV